MRPFARRRGPFLVELTVDILLFGICAAVCVCLLLQARSMSRESRELTQAVYLAQSAAESWKASGETPVLSGADGYSGVFQVHGRELDLSIWREGRLLYTLEGVTFLG